MSYADWIKNFNAAVTVTDADGNIIEINEKAAGRPVSQKHGGMGLIGKNLRECHPEHANKKIAELMESKRTNAYTIEKDGVKKLVYQAPWYKDGKFMGLVELSLEIPFDMPHFIRK